MVTIYHHQDQATVAHVQHTALNVQAITPAQNVCVGGMEQNVNLNAEAHVKIVQAQQHVLTVLWDNMDPTVRIAAP